MIVRRFVAIEIERKKCPGLGGLGGKPTQAVGASFWPRQEPKTKAGDNRGGNVQRRKRKMACRKLLRVRPSHPPTQKEMPNYPLWQLATHPHTRSRKIAASQLRFMLDKAASFRAATFVFALGSKHCASRLLMTMPTPENGANLFEPQWLRKFGVTERKQPTFWLANSAARLPSNDRCATRQC